MPIRSLIVWGSNCGLCAHEIAIDRLNIHDVRPPNRVEFKNPYLGGGRHFISNSNSQKLLSNNLPQNRATQPTAPLEEILQEVHFKLVVPSMPISICCLCRPFWNRERAFT